MSGRAVRELLAMLGMKPGSPGIPVFSTAATTGQGVGELARWLDARVAGGTATLAA